MSVEAVADLLPLTGSSEPAVATPAELGARREVTLHELELPAEGVERLKLEGSDSRNQTEEERSESSKSSKAPSDAGRENKDEPKEDDGEDGDDDDSKAGVMKRAWAPEEDTRLLELVEEYGPRRWSVIAQHLQGRVGKQCRERCVAAAWPLLPPLQRFWRHPPHTPQRARASSSPQWSLPCGTPADACISAPAAGTTTSAPRSTKRTGPRRRTSSSWSSSKSGAQSGPRS